MPDQELEWSDRDLMRKFYHDDPRAFGRITECWRPRLLRFFRALGFSGEDAEDLTQDTLLKLFLTKETFSFDLSQPLAPFLYTIARNEAIKWWRRRKNDPTLLCCFAGREGEEALEFLQHARREALPPLVREETLTDLWLCIWELTKTELTYLTLCGKHGLGDLSHTEIAVVLGKRNLAEITRISQRTRAKLCAAMVRRGYRHNFSVPAKEGKECLR